MRTKLAVSIPLVLLACTSSSSTSSKPELTAKEVPPEVAPIPALDLVGTSAPGDVWTFGPTGTPGEYRLGHDNGTPATVSRPPRRMRRIRKQSIS